MRKALNHEWEMLNDDPQAQASVDEWGADLGLSLPHLDDVLPAITAQPDRVLGYLIDRTQHGDTLAGRSIIQAFIVKMLRMVSSADSAVTFEEMVSQLWIQIADYPLQSRPHSIAANLVLDAYKFVVKSATRHRHDVEAWAVRLENVDRACADQRARAEMVDELLLAARDQGLLTESTLQILTAVYRDATKQADVATVTGISHAAVRQRCSAGVHHLRTHLAELLPAA